MGKLKLSNEKEWRAFELESWRRALRERGLQLRSLDPEHQFALFEAVRPVLSWRKEFLLSHPVIARRFRLAGRLAAMLAFVAVGYVASFVVPAASKWSHAIGAAGLRSGCEMTYAEIAASQAPSSVPDDDCKAAPR